MFIGRRECIRKNVIGEVVFKFTSIHITCIQVSQLIDLNEV